VSAGGEIVTAGIRLGFTEEVDLTVDWAVRSFEMAERNRAALCEWRDLWIRGAIFTDAARSPVERLLFNRWYAEHRADARGWLARNMFFRRQAG